MNKEERRQRQRDEEQRQQNIYFCNLQIDRNRKIIEHCTSEITQLELKLLDPFVSESERSKLRGLCDFRRSNLREAQAELLNTKERLDQLEKAGA